MTETTDTEGAPHRSESNRGLDSIIESRPIRARLIEQIEERTGSKVIVYFCGDRPVAPSQLGEDAIRHIYEHLLALSSDCDTKNLALFLYSRGGAIEVPWRIVTMLREFCDNLYMIVPYKAYSAATLVALGCDKILMGRKGELGPIDPSLQISPGPAAQALPPQEIGVEDISSYLTFVRSRAGLTDQSALADAVKVLAEKLGPPTLGSIERTYSHIRLVARKLLSLCKPPIEEPRMSGIIEALTERIYLHGHGIGRKEAKEIGLQIEIPDENVEKLIWDLYLAYETPLKLNSSADVEAFLSPDQDETLESNALVACIESVKKLHVFQCDIEFKRFRNIPPQPTINLSLQLGLPPGVAPGQLTQQMQVAVQQLLQQAEPALRAQVAEELRRQSPVMATGSRTIRGRWVELGAQGQR